MIIKAADADRTMDLDIKELQDGFEYEKMLKNSETANQVVYRKSTRSGGYVKY